MVGQTRRRHSQSTQGDIQVSIYKTNKERAIYRNTEPTLTDQSQAANTDINIIVTQFLRTGQAPGQQTPVYGDFTDFPTDLKTMFELARSVKDKIQELPDALQGMPLEQLVQLTNDQINDMLPKPAPEPDKETK